MQIIDAGQERQHGDTYTRIRIPLVFSGFGMVPLRLVRRKSQDYSLPEALLLTLWRQDNLWMSIHRNFRLRLLLHANFTSTYRLTVLRTANSYSVRSSMTHATAVTVHLLTYSSCERP